MFKREKITMWILQSDYKNVDTFYPVLKKELNSLIEGEPNLIANLANISSWIYHSMPELNWCGFYLWDNQANELVLGPFQGMPACLRIRPERGVCGASYTQQKTLNIADVHAFPGHIACDANSRSELVIPLIVKGKVLGVLDLDSPKINRFSDRDEKELTLIINELAQKIF